MARGGDMDDLVLYMMVFVLSVLILDAAFMTAYIAYVQLEYKNMCHDAREIRHPQKISACGCQSQHRTVQPTQQYAYFYGGNYMTYEELKEQLYKDSLP